MTAQFYCIELCCLHKVICDDWQVKQVRYHIHCCKCTADTACCLVLAGMLNRLVVVADWLIICQTIGAVYQQSNLATVHIMNCPASFATRPCQRYFCARISFMRSTSRGACGIEPKTFHKRGLAFTASSEHWTGVNVLVPAVAGRLRSPCRRRARSGEDSPIGVDRSCRSGVDPVGQGRTGCDAGVLARPSPCR